MEVNSNSYANFVFSEEEKKLIRDHVKNNLQESQKHLANENTANTVEKNIVYVIQEWNKEVEATISLDVRSRKTTYSFNKHIIKSDVNLIKRIYLNHFQYMEECVVQGETKIYSEEHALHPWFYYTPNAGKVIISWTADHPLITGVIKSPIKAPIADPRTPSLIVNGLWKKALNGKGTDHSIVYKERTFHLHSCVVSQADARQLLSNASNEQALETMLKYAYTGDEAIENLDADPRTPSIIVNGLWKKALNGKGTDHSIVYKERTFHLHSCVVSQADARQLLSNASNEQALETMLKYVYIGDEAIENLDFDALVDLFAFDPFASKFGEKIIRLISNLFPITDKVMQRSKKLLELGHDYIEQKLIALGLNLASTLKEEDFIDLLVNSFPLQALECFSNNADETVSEEIRAKLNTCKIVSKMLTSK